MTETFDPKNFPINKVATPQPQTMYEPGDAPPDSILNIVPTVEQLTARHWMYSKFKPMWDEYINLYEGIDVMSYILQHTRESDDAIRKRRARAYYVNLVAPIVDLFTEFIFRKPITRQSKTEAKGVVEKTVKKVKEVLNVGQRNVFDEFWENSDGKKRPIKKFMIDADKLRQIFGYVDILVDRPSAEQIADGMEAKSYAIAYTPENCINWSMDANGEFIWLRFREYIEDFEDPYKLEPEEITDESYYYVTWTKKEWVKHKIDPKSKDVIKVGGGAHNLGIVPVYRLKNKSSFKYQDIGIALVQDIAGVCKAILRWTSLLDEELHNKALNILRIAAWPDMPNTFTLSEGNVLAYTPVEGAGPPEFMAPTSEPAANLRANIKDEKDTILKIVKLKGGVAVEEQTSPSGIALARIFNETNNAISAKADALQDCEDALCRFVGLWANTPWKGSISYPDDFDIYNLTDELNILLSAREALTSETAIKNIEKGVVKKMLPDVDPDAMKTIEEEIDEAQAKPGQAIQSPWDMSNLDEEGNEINPQDQGWNEEPTEEDLSKYYNE
ncbi:hypothetical protein M0R19_04880 [Candidatus Pacearchaeota archaeon]|nr:hypothetical protein [Candidatus Pacearchaeota archaeon]